MAYEAEVDPDTGATHYVNAGALDALYVRMWWREYRFRLMAAVPWQLTMQEYLERYRYWHELYEALGRALRGGDPVGDRGTQAHC